MEIPKTNLTKILYSNCHILRLHKSECWTTEKEKRCLYTAEMHFLRAFAGFRMKHHKVNENIVEEF
jgi:hypothetical protein